MISGPIATMTLGDQGADVIKVEPPGGGDLVRSIGPSKAGMAPIFATSNRSKRSVVINLKSAGGRAVLERLVARADVFVQNFRPGTAQRMGVGEEAIRAIRKDIIYVSITGFGDTGPYAHKRVYDPVVQALSGLASIQGDRVTGRPRMVRTLLPDKLTALTAAQAITAALLSRERTGEGQHVRLAMLDAMVSFLWPEGMARYTFIKPEPIKPEPIKPEPIKPERDASAELAGPKSRPQVRDLVFETTDGYITVGAVSNREWAGLARAVGRPEWIDDPRFATPSSRVVNWDERLELTAQEIAKHSSAEWLARLDAEDVPSAPINDRSSMISDPQIVASQLIVESDHPHVGRIRQTRPAARFDRTPSEIRRPAPILGEHTDEIMGEIGFDTNEIAELRATGAIG